jgi:hypothetical protein
MLFHARTILRKDLLLETTGDNRGSGKRTSRRRRAEPALVSGTSGEFLGRKPLPRSVTTRPALFIFGPAGVGKTSVARHLLGEDALYLDDQALIDTLSHRVRYRRWPDEIATAMGLILDGPCFLGRRPSVLKALQDLVNQRVAAAMRTVVCEGEDGSPLSELIDAVDVDARATLVLRFPVGRGRRRFANRICDELGYDRQLAMEMALLEPWTYSAVRARLERMAPRKTARKSDRQSPPT